MQVLHEVGQRDASEHTGAGRREQVLHVGKPHDLGHCGHIHVVANTVEHAADELHHIIVLGAVLPVSHERLRQRIRFRRGGPRRARSRKAHRRHSIAAFAHEQLRRAAAEEDVGVAVQKHRAPGVAVDEVHEQILRRERMLSHKAQPTREHHLRHPALPNGRKRRTHGLVPGLARIGLEGKWNDRALAGRCSGHHAREASHATGIHRTERVYLEKPPAFVLDEHDFRQHEPQPREGGHQLIGRRGIGGVEPVEREEHRRLVGIAPGGDLTQRAALAVLVFHIAQTGQRDAAAESHIAGRVLLVVVDELVGESFLQPAERIHHIRLNGHIARVDSGHLPSLSPSEPPLIADYSNA